MSSPARRGPLQWTVAVPLLGLLLLALSWPKTEQPLLLGLVVLLARRAAEREGVSRSRLKP